MNPLSSTGPNLASSRRSMWWNRLVTYFQGLRTVVRSFPSTLLWPGMLFCTVCGFGIWVVILAARGTAADSQARALSLAKDAAVAYGQLLSVAFSLTQVLASLVVNNPQYDAVSGLFNATAPALASAAPLTCVRALELAPAAVVRHLYPLAGNEFFHGFDMLADPAISANVLHAISNPDLSVEGPLPPLPGEGASSGTLLVIRKAIHVPVTDPRDTFGRPDEPNPLCGAPCGYNATTGTKFWGIVAVMVQLDSLRSPMGNIMVSAPLRTLASLGYRYALVAPGQQYGSGSSAPVVVESSPGGAGGCSETVTTAVELGPGAQWTLYVGPSTSSWMPAWYGGVVAAVVVLSLAASLLLFGLLVSRRQNQMLLQLLLPPELIRDLQTENAQEPLEPKPMMDAETPADVLMGLLAALLAGLPPDLRDVVLLRTMLKQRVDVYRPFNLGARMKEAQLDSDVASALMRQLGNPDDLCLGGRCSSSSGSRGGSRCGSDEDCCNYEDGGWGAMGRSGGRGSGGGGNMPGGGNGVNAEVLVLSDVQLREQELARKCQSFKGVLSYILSGAGGELGLDADRRSTASYSVGQQRQRPGGGGGGSGSRGGAQGGGGTVLSGGVEALLLEHGSGGSGTATAVAEATATVAAAEWAAAARRSRIMSAGVVQPPSPLSLQQPQQQSSTLSSRPTSASTARTPQSAWSCPQQPDLPTLPPPPPSKSGLHLYLKPRAVGETSATEGRTSRISPLPREPASDVDVAIGTNESASADAAAGGGGGGSDSSGDGGATAAAASCHGTSVCADALIIPGNVPPMAEEEVAEEQERVHKVQKHLGGEGGGSPAAGGRSPLPGIARPRTTQGESPRSPASVVVSGFSRSQRRSSGGPMGHQTHTQHQENRTDGAGRVPLWLLSSMPATTPGRATHGSVIRRGGTNIRTDSPLSRASVMVAAPPALLSYSSDGELLVDEGEEGGEVEVMAVAASGASVKLPRRIVRTATPPRPLVEDVERLLAQCDSWQFDTWGLQEASCGHALSSLGFFIMQREGLVERFRLEPLKLARLLRTLESGYPASNPYHNSAHAADVLHTLHVLLHGARLTTHYLDSLGLLATYFAAIVHDYGHPGLTNDFLVATSHPLALRYNDRSPLECHHAAAAFTLLAERPDLDITTSLNRTERTAFRKQVIELVLATDMKQHFAILNQFNTIHRLATSYVTKGLPPAPPPEAHQTVQQTAEYIVPAMPLNDTERLLSLQVMLKAADIGHLGAGLERHKRWLSVLEEEFFRQGDKERQLGIPISPLFDRAKKGVSKSQVGFYEFVALPLVRAAAEAFPGAAPLLHCFKANFNHWRQVEEEEDEAEAAAAEKDSGGAEVGGGGTAAAAAAAAAPPAATALKVPAGASGASGGGGAVAAPQGRPNCFSTAAAGSIAPLKAPP